MAAISSQPWRDLPPEAAAVFAPGLPALAEEIIEAISQGVPEYALPLEGTFGRGLRRGVEEALGRFLDLFGSEAAMPTHAREIYVELGRGELRAGRPLEALLAAYRLGARVAWRRQAAAGEAAGLEPQTLYLLAESIFAYIDEISAESVEGYALEQAAAAGETPAPPAAARAAAGAGPAGRPAKRCAPPPTAPAGRCRSSVAAIVVRTDEPGALALRLGQGVIVADDPAGRVRAGPRPRRARAAAAQLEAALAASECALGPDRTGHARPPPAPSRARRGARRWAGERGWWWRTTTTSSCSWPPTRA